MDERSRFRWGIQNRYYSMKYEKGYDRLVTAIKNHCDVKYDPMRTTSYYSQIDNTIYLRTKNSRILIHEFVHYLQCRDFPETSHEPQQALMDELVAEWVAMRISRCHLELSELYFKIHEEDLIERFGSFNMMAVHKDRQIYLCEVRKALPNVDQYVGFDPRRI